MTKNINRNSAGEELTKNLEKFYKDIYHHCLSARARKGWVLRKSNLSTSKVM